MSWIHIAVAAVVHSIGRYLGCPRWGMITVVHCLTLLTHCSRACIVFKNGVLFISIMYRLVVVWVGSAVKLILEMSVGFMRRAVIRPQYSMTSLYVIGFDTRL